MALGTAVFLIFIITLLIQYRWARITALCLAGLCVLALTRMIWVENHPPIHEAGCVNGYKPDPKPQPDDEWKDVGTPIVPCE